MDTRTYHNMVAADTDAIPGEACIALLENVYISTKYSNITVIEDNKIKPELQKSTATS